MKKGRITPHWIDSLKENEIFVFGSNLAGMQGESYAIPTMQGGVETIRPYVDRFIAYAKRHSEKHFLVTPIGRHRRFRSRRHRPIVREGKGDEEHQLAGEFLGGDRIKL